MKVIASIVRTWLHQTNTYLEQHIEHLNTTYPVAGIG
jgi:hypothetical protein